MKENRRDLACGLLFMAVGLFFIVAAWLTLPIGRAVAMGPGYFPIALGAVLAGLGLLTALGGDARESAADAVPWRGVALIAGAVLFFALAVRGLGFAPALFVASFMATMASGQMSARAGLVFSAAMTGLCVAVFVYALRLPYAVFGDWLRM